MVNLGNNTTNAANKLGSLAPYVQSTVFLSICWVIGLFGNVTIIVFYRRRLKLSINVYIFYLAIVDLLATVLAITNNVAELVIKTYPKVDIVCRTTTFLEYFLLGIPYSVMLAVAVDRYRRICHPLGWQVNRRRAILACGLATVWAFVNALPVFAMYKWRRIELKSSYRLVCQVAVDGDIRRFVTSFGIFVVLKTIIRIVCYVMLYGRIIYAIRKHFNFLSSSTCHRGRDSGTSTVECSIHQERATLASSSDHYRQDSTASSGICLGNRDVRTMKPHGRYVSKHTPFQASAEYVVMADLSSRNEITCQTYEPFSFPTAETVSVKKVYPRVSSIIREAYRLQVLSKSAIELRALGSREAGSVRLIDIKATKIMIILTFVIVISLIPFFGNQMYRIVHGNYNEEDIGLAYGWFRLLGFSAYINIPANFITYCVFHVDFRRWVISLLKCS